MARKSGAVIMLTRAFVLSGLAVTLSASPALAEDSPAPAENPSAIAANPCDLGAFCVYEDAELGGDHFEVQGNVSDWASGLATSKLINKDSSWQNRYQSWYWACVYDNENYGNVTVWVAQGITLPRAGSGMYVNRGESNRGRSQGVNC